MKTILHLLSAILVLAVAGCGFGMKSIPPKHSQYSLRNIDAEIAAPNDTNFYHWSKPQTVELPRVALIVAPDDPDCGACQTNSPLVTPAFIQVSTLDFDTSEPVNVIEVMKSTNLINWQQAYIDDPHLWIGLGHHKIVLTNTEPKLFFALRVRDTP